MDDQAIHGLVALLDDPADPQGEVLLGRLEADAVLRDRAWAIALERREAQGTPPPAALATIILRHDAEPLVDAIALADDLESAVWLLPRLDLPRHDFAPAGRAALDALAARTRHAADGRALARALGRDWGFAGDAQRMSEPQASYLPEVLVRRSGLPIALTALWMLVGRRLGLGCVAIALPGMVVGRWQRADGVGGYVDLFGGGADLDRADLDRLCHQAGAGTAAAYLTPATDRTLIRRMARNLVLAYLRQGDPLRATIAHAVSVG